MIETRSLKNVIFIQIILSFELSRKIINIYNHISIVILFDIHFLVPGLKRKLGLRNHRWLQLVRDEHFALRTVWIDNNSFFDKLVLKRTLLKTFFHELVTKFLKWGLGIVPEAMKSIFKKLISVATYNTNWLSKPGILMQFIMILKLSVFCLRTFNILPKECKTKIKTVSSVNCPCKVFIYVHWWTYIFRFCWPLF